MNNFFKTSDNVHIYFSEKGEGDPILLLHGAYLSSKIWDVNIDELAKSNRVISMDFRGHGLSTKELMNHTVERYAADVNELIEHLELKDVALVGWSLGGAVSLKYWELFKEKDYLRGMGLIDTSPCPAGTDEWNVHVFRGYNIQGLFDRMADQIDDFNSNNYKMARGWYLNKEKSEKEIERMSLIMRHTPPWITNAIYSNFFFQDLKDVLKTINIPVISMVPKSKIKGADYQKQEIENCKLHIFETGHALFSEEPELFNANLLDFLETLRP